MATATPLDLSGITRAWLRPADVLTISLSFLSIYIIASVGQAVYNAYYGPLSRYPGPTLRALSNYPHIFNLSQGTAAAAAAQLHQKYGPVVRIAPDQLSYASGAEAWKDVHGFKRLVYKDPDFYRKPFNKTHGLITADDATHSRQRKLLSHAFADKTLKELEPMLKQWTGKMKGKLAERAGTGESVDMLKYYNCTTFDIMGDLCFSEGLDMLENGEYSDWVKTIFESIKEVAKIRAIKFTSKFLSWAIDSFIMDSPTVRAKQARHWNYSKERVDRRLKRTPEQPDLWSKILEKSQGPGGLTVDELHSNASLFMVAGTETTATALSGTTYHLLTSDPSYLRKLTEEIRSTHSTFDDITLESVARLTYLQAVLREGMRMYPPVPVALPRKVPKGGSMLCGEFVPEDTIVGVHHLATYRNEEHFKKPYEFRPERWLGDPEFKDDHLDALEPFSFGPRNCLGKNLAWHEMRLLLTTVLLHFDLELCDESKDWTDQRIYTLWEKKPLMCRLTPAKA
ncbi:Isotrichodermin C-15 hydroxylase [Lecanosticta acicola]|uniref:Isotrichodermin C-15 hydroxylase n=1 Tax=Lecanosticta acicola TaxID=111012 RepID=A0AAI9EDZ2_9PEZI|nr:Isotrichodermin C-15 hydroxylase [Lecanosticta acicola]